LHKIFGVCGSISQLFVWLVLLLAANNVTSVTAYVILYSYIQVHTLVQIKSMFHHVHL